MSAQTAVTLNAKSYAPSGTIAPGILSWVDRSAGIHTGFSVLTQKASLANAKRPTSKFEYRVTVPVIETSTTASVPAGDVLRVGGGTFSFWFADSATAAERADVIARVTDALTAMSSQISNLDPAYA